MRYKPPPKPDALTMNQISQRSVVRLSAELGEPPSTVEKALEFNMRRADRKAKVKHARRSKNKAARVARRNRR